MADSIRGQEDKRLRRQETRKSIILYWRTYSFPIDGMALIPAKGEAVDLDGVTGTGSLQPRVYADPVRQKSGEAQLVVQLTFFQGRSYA